MPFHTDDAPADREKSITFIHPQLIRRLESGEFIVERRSKPSSLKYTDRRDHFSPLAVTKRCIRYEPNIFYDRKATLLSMLAEINNPEKKIFLLTGPQGVGKTALARGIVELMGGGKEQVLWFDINIHTDIEEITTFLLQYIGSIAEALGLSDAKEPSTSATEKHPTGDPVIEMATLEQALGKLVPIPLMIVIDNIEFIVDPEFRIQSQTLKAFFNVLLSFPNIKMILAGERLPYADMSLDNAIVSELKLQPLQEKDTHRVLEASIQSHPLPEKESTPDLENTFITLHRRLGALPWELKPLLSILRDTQQPTILLKLSDSLSQKAIPPIELLIEHVYTHLSPLQQRSLEILSALRHPVDKRILAHLLRDYHPDGYENAFDEGTTSTYFRALLRKNFPPQKVLQQIHLRFDHKPDIQPAYDTYRVVKKWVYQQLSLEDKKKLHTILQRFYMEEKNKPEAEQLYPVRSVALISEANIHHQHLEKLRNEASTPVTGHATPEAGDWEVKTYLAQSQQSAVPQAYSGEIPYPNHSMTDAGTYAIPLAPRAPQPAARILKKQPVRTPSQFDAILEHTVLESEEELALHLITDAETAHTEDSPQTLVFGDEASLVYPPPLDDRNTSAENDTRQASEQEKTLQKQLADAILTQNKASLIQALLALAEERLRLGCIKGERGALDCLEKAYENKQHLTPLLWIHYYRLFAEAHRQSYHHREAIDYFKRAESLARSQLTQTSTSNSELHTHLLLIYEQLAELSLYRDQLPEACTFFQNALRHAKHCPETSSQKQGELAFSLAQSLDELGQNDMALNAYQQALNYAEQAKQPLICAASLSNMGSIYLDLEAYPEAAQCFEKALTFDTQANYWEGVLKSMDLLALSYLKQKKWEKTEALYEQALHLAKTQRNTLWSARIYLKLGNIFTLRQLPAKALVAYQSASACGQDDLSQESLNHIRDKIETLEKALSASAESESLS